jgi:hypothetical protein
VRLAGIVRERRPHLAHGRLEHRLAHEAVTPNGIEQRVALVELELAELNSLR